jgi:sugar phosphate isomerase/epimerase
MHPLYCGDRSVVVTLAQALALVGAIGSESVGLMLDSYHLWWDPELTRIVTSATARIFGVQLADWLAPPPHPLNGRGMLGDGSIDLRSFRELVDAAGYNGLLEVEIFNPDVWAIDPADTLELVAERFHLYVDS